MQKYRDISLKVGFLPHATLLLLHILPIVRAVDETSQYVDEVVPTERLSRDDAEVLPVVPTQDPQHGPDLVSDCRRHLYDEGVVRWLQTSNTNLMTLIFSVAITITQATLRFSSAFTANRACM